MHLDSKAWALESVNRVVLLILGPLSIVMVLDWAGETLIRVWPLALLSIVLPIPPLAEGETGRSKYAK